MWSVNTLREKAALPGASFAVAFSRDGKALLVSSLSEAPASWDLERNTKRPIPAYSGGRIKGRVSCVDISLDRRVAALGFNDGRIQLLDLDSGRETELFDAHKGGVGSLAFSALADKLVSGGRDKAVAFWDTRTGKIIQASAEHRGSVCAVAISADGTRLVSGCNANTIKLWNATDMTKSLASLPYHCSGIRTLCFAPAGETLASGSEDNTVKLWSVGSYLEVASFRYDDHVRRVSFSPDGNHLAIVTDKGALHLLHAVSLQEANRDAAAIAQ